MLTASHEINESQSQVTASAKNVLESNPMLQPLKVSLCVCMYLSDEAIPKGLSGETSPVWSQGQRSNQLELWVHQRGTHSSPSPLLSKASLGEFSPLSEFTLSWALHQLLQAQSWIPSHWSRAHSSLVTSVPGLSEGPRPGKFYICSCSVRPVQSMVPVFLTYL